jgi:NAD(P)-dependent dehydrogenase (short-subunit alcohol dehydrogenase family)
MIDMEGFDLTGRVAVVTGGYTGIGKAAALLLARRGADVVIAARRIERLEPAAAEIAEATGRRCKAIAADVTDPDQAAALVEATVAAFGRLDILVNNAGRASHGSYAKLSPEVWNKDLSLNLSSVFYLSQAALPHLVESGHGAIVNISSMAGNTGTMGVAGYAPAKAGVQMFTRVASAEWGPKGVRVNCVAPGMIATELAKKGWGQANFDPVAACQGFPLRRPGEPAEVAQAIVFLASDAASYITGETLVVGGGPQLKGMVTD